MINNSRTPVKGDLYRGLLFFGGTMKKIFSYIYIIMVCLCVCGCAKKEYYYEGKELVDRAAKLHTELESATVRMTNEQTGEIEQHIEYRFEGEVMQYMYVGCDEAEGIFYYEYNNGTELNYITLPDETEWNFAAKGADGYYTYSKASRHYFADGAQLFNDFEAAVVSSEIIQHSGTDLKLTYDLDKLSGYNAFADYGKFNDFGMVFHFNPEGYCTMVHNFYTLSNGYECSYNIFIEKRDNTQPVERVDIDAIRADENRIF